MRADIVKRGTLQARMHGRWSGVACKLRSVVEIVKRHWPTHDVPVGVDLLEEPGQPTAWKVEVSGTVVLRVYQDGEKIRIKA